MHFRSQGLAGRAGPPRRPRARPPCRLRPWLAMARTTQYCKPRWAWLVGAGCAPRAPPRGPLHSPDKCSGQLPPEPRARPAPGAPEPRHRRHARRDPRAARRAYVRVRTVPSTLEEFLPRGDPDDAFATVCGPAISLSHISARPAPRSHIKLSDLRRPKQGLPTAPLSRAAPYT